MTELDYLLAAWCVLAPITFLTLLYFVFDYVRMCRASRFELPTPSPIPERRPRTTMPTPLYGERR